MKHHPLIIAHLIGFTLVVFGTWLLILYNLFHTPDNHRLSLSQLLHPDTLIKLITYRHDPGLTCTIPSPSPPTNAMTLSCQNQKCYFLIVNDNQEMKRLPAFTDQAKTPLASVSGVIYDEKRGLLSYVAPDTTRVVINLDSELIQTIDESPGVGRELQFITYLPDSGLLRYHDPISGYDYFYSADKIALYRQQCP